MRFAASHLFADVDLATFERLYFDEAFNVAMCQAVHIERQLLAYRTTGNRVHREVVVYPMRAIPRPIQAFLGTERVGYQENIDYELGSGQATFACVPTLMAERVTTSGTVTFAARGTGVERAVVGEVRVKVFGLGGAIERFIVGDVEKSFADAAKFTASYLANHRDQLSGAAK